MSAPEAIGGAGVTYTSGYVEAFPRVRLLWRKWQKRRCKGWILLLHGFGEHSGRYLHVCDFLLRDGFSILTWDHRGHGRSDGARGVCSEFSWFTDEITFFLHFERDLSLPLFLFGHSLGGEIVLQYTLNYCRRRKEIAQFGKSSRPGSEKPPITGVIVSSPYLEKAFELPLWKRWGSAIGFHFFRNFVVGSPVGERPPLACDPEIRRQFDNDPLCHGFGSSGLIGWMDRKGQELSNHAHEIDLPLYCHIGSKDQHVSVAAVSRFFEALGTDPSHKQFRLYEDCYHELHNEPDWNMVVFKELSGWLNQQLVRSPGMIADPLLSHPVTTYDSQWVRELDIICLYAECQKRGIPLGKGHRPGLGAALKRWFEEEDETGNDAK
jgi:alpha-beta hydrolase superfamily lysophospholipase